MENFFFKSPKTSFWKDLSSLPPSLPSFLPSFLMLKVKKEKKRRKPFRFIVPTLDLEQF